MAEIPNFQTVYNSHVLPALSAMEADRKKNFNYLMLGAITALLITIAVFYFQKGVLFFLASGAGVYFYYKHIVKLHYGRYKQEIIKPLIASLNPTLQYEPHHHISRRDYDLSKLHLDKVNRYYGSDLVSGTIDKTAIRFSELLTQYESGTKEDKEVKTIFQGIFFIADFNKHFSGETFVLPDKAERMFGSLGQFFQKMNFARPQLVLLENPDFEKAFAVYSTDPVEARYILSTTLMERILELKKQLPSPISLSFVQSNIFISLPISNNLFECSPIYRTLIKPQQMEENYRYLRLCIEIVETLDLNTRIWSKA